MMNRIDKPTVVNHHAKKTYVKAAAILGAVLIAQVVYLSCALIDARHESREVRGEFDASYVVASGAFAEWADQRRTDVENGLDVYRLEVTGENNLEEGE